MNERPRWKDSSSMIEFGLFVEKVKKYIAHDHLRTFIFAGIVHMHLDKICIEKTNLPLLVNTFQHFTYDLDGLFLIGFECFRSVQ